MSDEERGRVDDDVAPEQESAADAPPPSGTAVVDEAPYVVASWGALPRYQCRRCSYDTLDRVEIERHIDVHRAEDALRAASARLRESAET